MAMASHVAGSPVPLPLPPGPPVRLTLLASVSWTLDNDLRPAREFWLPPALLATESLGVRILLLTYFTIFALQLLRPQTSHGKATYKNPTADPVSPGQPPAFKQDAV